MSNMPYANPIQGNLTIGNSLIIYDGGYYSLDGGSTVSSDTIGPDTLITAPSVSAVSIRLRRKLFYFSVTRQIFFVTAAKCFIVVRKACPYR